MLYILLSIAILLRYYHHAYHVNKYLASSDEVYQSFGYSKNSGKSYLLALVMQVLLLSLLLLKDYPEGLFLLPYTAFVHTEYAKRKEPIKVFDQVIIIENRLFYWKDIYGVDETTSSTIILRSDACFFREIRSRYVANLQALKRLSLDRINTYN